MLHIHYSFDENDGFTLFDEGKEDGTTTIMLTFDSPTARKISDAFDNFDNEKMMAALINHINNVHFDTK